MTVEISQLLTAVAERTLDLAQQDHELRSKLRQLAVALLRATEPHELPAQERAVEIVNGEDGADASVPDEAVEAESRETADSVVISVAAPAAAPGYQEPASPVVPAVMVFPTGTSEEVTDAELPLIEQRLRLKAEGARWATTRRQRLLEGADFRLEIDPLDQEIIEKAKSAPDCYLWMCRPNFSPPADPILLDNVAGCFETTADAVSLVREILGGPAEDRGALERALELLAESQSALRAAVERLGQGQDQDQLRAYRWLRGMCYRIEFYIHRYMRIDDMAEPQSWSDIASRIEAADAEWQQDRQRTRKYHAGIKKIRYHLKALSEKRNGDRLHDWGRITQTVHDLVQDGVPPSNTDIRELLLPVVDDLPDVDMPPGFQRVLREIDLFLASRPAGLRIVSVPEPTAAVQQVRELLRSRAVVLIGGNRRPLAYEALKAAFGLKELDWIETREHESIVPFESHIARPDVAVVLLAIRWSSHAFGDIRKYCEKHGKPLVRLPGGYNPNQVAAQVLSQCGDRLQRGSPSQS